MSMIYFTIWTLFLASTISASLAPRVVYSAVIYNAQNASIQCSVVWSQPSGSTLESGLFAVEKCDYYVVEEKTVDMGTWEAYAIIEEIHCGNLVLTAPFDNVTSPVKNWEFHVQPDEIVSFGLSSYETNN
ncbi:unnamed protein product [Rotaria sp. Silwood2]|nr:unnamed protein product [Rotaria sp. Silwood2]CAF2837836.1 unnamed protein product [Rotaria sp. Silwood2]CAF3302360.1 unnamed protein product [Rotaria sp. Silwood2]CAF4025932.1 unnamed protein product [Rotaria sp. Silwood2]CAF4056588.1 unnamed protein product [Rotaria sp. Silwood2]